jgi:hypothetical protein
MGTISRDKYIYHSGKLDQTCMDWGLRLNAGAKSENIDRECPVQINRMFGSKQNLFFSEPR